MCEAGGSTACKVASAVMSDITSREMEYAEAPEASSVRFQLRLCDKNLLRTMSQNHPLFRQLPHGEFETALTCWEIDEGREIFEEGRKPLNLYVLKEGKVQVTSRNRKIVLSNPGTCFGEQGLMTTSQRLESAQAFSFTCFWRLSATDYESFLQNIRWNQREILLEAAIRFSLFADLPQEMHETLVSILTPMKYSFEAKIVTQGESGDCMFLIVSGEVVVTESETQKRNLGPGEWFGEQAILYHFPRTASVTASSPEVTCLSLSAKAIVEPLGKYIHQQIYKNTLRIALDRSVYFSHFSNEAKSRLADSMRVETFEEGETVIKAKTWKGFALWVIVRGAVRSEAGSFGLYSCIGDEMVLGTPEGSFEEDVVADRFEVAIASIGRTELEECLCVTSSLPPSRIPMSAVPQIRLFDGLPRRFISRLCLDVLLVAFSPGEYLLHEDKPSEWIYIIKSGTVRVFKSGKLVRIPTLFDFLGELNILPDNEKWVRAVSENYTECWKIEKNSFIGSELPSALQSRYKQWERAWQVSGPHDLTPVTSLTEPEADTTVTLATSSQGHLYAVKTIPKSSVSEPKFQRELAAERDILLRLNHPLIPHMLKTLRSTTHIFFLSEFVNGSSLLQVIRERRVLPLADARFYCGAVLLVLEYLHSRKILYRNLQPENVLIDTDGYVQLIDFSCAKFAERTKSIIGAPHYMAPEVILGKHYDASADLWSLGVLLFEMMAGGVPFAQLDEDPATIYQVILSQPLVLPAHISEHVDAARLLQRLLSHFPSDRGSATSLRSDSFFADFAFDSVLAKTASPPFIPRQVDYSQLISRARKEQLTLEDGNERLCDLADWSAAF